MNFHECVRRFCIMKLARILYDCLGCSVSDRALLDWLTAEKFVLAHEHMVATMAELFRSGLNTAGASEDFVSFDRLCGRAVWNAFYQPLRKELHLGSAGIPHYVCIRFG